MVEPIIKTIVVASDADLALEIFVTRMADWWPLDGHSSSASDGNAALSVTAEPMVGGALFETRHDGTRDEWGKILEYEPGKRIATTWHPGNNKDAPTLLEVDFRDAGKGRCQVTLTHSGWDAWGDRAREMRENYDKGWEFVFGDRYVAGCGDLA